MSEKTYQIDRDSHNRLCASIGEGLTVGIKVLSETDPRRIERNEHAYAVLDIQTALGCLRIRDIRVLWSETHERFFVRWRQWHTGQFRNDRKEYLDVAGPQDRNTRDAFEDVILDVFEQIKEEAAMGTLGRSNPELQDLKDSLEKTGDGEEITAATDEADGPAATIAEEASA